MYACMHVHIYIYIYIHRHTYIHTHTHTPYYVRMCVRSYVHTSGQAIFLHRMRKHACVHTDLHHPPVTFMHKKHAPCIVSDSEATPAAFYLRAFWQEIHAACKQRLEMARRLVVVGGDHTLSVPARVFLSCTGLQTFFFWAFGPRLQVGVSFSKGLGQPLWSDFGCLPKPSTPNGCRVEVLSFPDSLMPSCLASKLHKTNYAFCVCIYLDIDISLPCCRSQGYPVIKAVAEKFGPVVLVCWLRKFPDWDTRFRGCSPSPAPNPEPNPLEPQGPGC